MRKDKLLTIIAVMLITARCLAQNTTNKVEDLGVVSERIGVFLDKSADPNFQNFEVDVAPVDKTLTNRVRLILATNDLITVTNLAGLPAGPMLLGLRSIYRDGTASPATTYKFNLLRSSPSAPTARAVQLIGVPGAQTLKLDVRKEVLKLQPPVRMDPPAPLSSTSISLPKLQQIESGLETPIRPPTNLPSAEMAENINKRTHKRRNE